jgi:uncharacterized protein (TIGR03118 family)
MLSVALCSLIVAVIVSGSAFAAEKGVASRCASWPGDGAECLTCPQPFTLCGFAEVDLVSDLPGAKILDPNLVNPWGLVFTPQGVLWTADNGTGLSTSYTQEGEILPGGIMIPAPGGGPGAPTGMVLNPTKEFELKHDKPARLLWATEDGTIVAWNPRVNAALGIIAADESEKGAVYKGIALGFVEDDPLIYATDFHNGRVDVFDHRFRKVGCFTDPKLACQSFAPFGIRNINGLLFVTFAKQALPEKKDDQAGPGNGFVDVFTPEGKFVTRLISHGPLNSPWGLEVSPATPARPYPVLFIGNFGDGKINAFALPKGAFLGPVKDRCGKPVVIEGLWSIEFKCAKVKRGD